MSAAKRVPFAAMATHFKAEFRAQLGGAKIVNLIALPAIFLFISRFAAGEHFTTAIMDGIDKGAFLAVGSIAFLSCWAMMQIVAQMYQDRLNGTLLRARFVPRGILTWALASTALAVVVIIAMVGIMTVGSALFVNTFGVSLQAVLTAFPLFLLAVISVMPFGFIVATMVRGIWSYLFAMMLLMALPALSGAFIPIFSYPLVLQYALALLPFYWVGALSRWAFLPGYPLAGELAGAATPWVAIIVLAAWGILGTVVAVRAIRLSLQKDSITSVTRLQSKFKQMSGF